MKTAICILLFAALGCRNGGAHTPPGNAGTSAAVTAPAAYTGQPGSQLTGKWKLIPALPSDTATGRVPFLNFMVSEKRVTGNTGCNNFSGTFHMDENGLSFNNDFISTKMACPGYDEVMFVKNLLRTDNFEIKGDTLVLQASQTPLSYWQKVK